MPSTLSSIAAKDGAAATVTGGILAVDKSGAGTGPFFAAQTIVDTQGVNTATVKAASTAAVATDTSVVVALNPNTIPAVTLTGATNNINNIAGTVSLPTGAATSAKQPALGIAGTPSTDVISVQGITSGTPMLVNQAGVWSTRALGNAGAVMDFPGQNSAVAANALQVGGQFNTTPTTITSGNSSPLQLDSAGNLLVNVKTGGAGGGIVTQATAANLNATVKITDGTTALPILAASSGAPSTSTPAVPVSLRDQLAAVQSGAPITIVAQTPTATANGATASRINAAASTNATNLKASGGQVYTIDVFNAAAYNVFLKLYNKASAPTVGTDTPIMTIPVQAGGGFSKTWPMGLTFTTGIAYAITKLQADSDTTVVVAGDLTGNTTWI